MTVGDPPDGILIGEHDGRVEVIVEGGRWEGSPAEAERLLTRLHYVLGRVRPGTNIVSMFVDGQLWGGKSLQSDAGLALADARRMLEDLLDRLPGLEAAAEQEGRRG